MTLLLLFSFKQGAVSRINALSITAVLYVVISVSALYKDGLLSLTKVRFDYIKDALMFGVPLIPHVIGIFLLSAIDRVLISEKLGVAAAGIYMVGVQLSLGMIVVFDAINKAFVPWLFRTLAENNITKLNNLVRFTYLYFIVVLFLGILSFWVGPFVVQFIVGDEYLEATVVIGWLCLGQAFSGMYLMVTNYLFYKKCTGLLSLVTITCGIFNIMLMVYAMEFYGLVGVSIAFAFSMCIRFVATWFLTLRVCGFSWLTPIMPK
ncbi:Polysaccharide biosynthesis protein [compost metagenome]